MKWIKASETPAPIKSLRLAVKYKGQQDAIFFGANGWTWTGICSPVKRSDWDNIEWLDETEPPSDSEAVDTESPVQYGTAFEADCEDGTWTFKMDEPFYVMAGRFKIIPLKK